MSPVPPVRDSAVASSEVDHALRVLNLEALALRVSAAFAQRDVDVLVIKGPVTNRWLYGDPLARSFHDIDILVAPASLAAATATLGGLGFRNDHDRVLGIHRPDYESSWTLGAQNVDLHTRIAGIPADRADDAWRSLSSTADSFDLHGRTLRTLSPTGRTMLLGLHAARSRADSRAQRDLEVGLTAVPDALWRDAAALATDLGAGSCFALGLSRSETGRALIARLGYAPEPTVESILLERAAPQEALVIAADLDACRRVRPSLVHAWFTTASEQRPPHRATAAAVARLPRALWLVLRARRRVRGHTRGRVRRREAPRPDPA